nr:hypothetical protein KK1_031172 [Cajanus cajan]
MVIAATFANATYERLPLEEEEDDGGGSVQGGSALGGSPPGIGGNSGGGGSGGGHLQGGIPDPSSLPLYNLPPNLLSNGGQVGHEAFPWAGHGRQTY